MKFAADFGLPLKSYDIPFPFLVPQEAGKLGLSRFLFAENYSRGPVKTQSF
jgi:hypothetical protein